MLTAVVSCEQIMLYRLLYILVLADFHMTVYNENGLWY